MMTIFVNKSRDLKLRVWPTFKYMTVTNTKKVIKKFIRLGKFFLKKALLRINIMSFFVDKSCIRNTNAPSDSAPVEHTYRYTFIKKEITCYWCLSILYFYLLATWYFYKLLFLLEYQNIKNVKKKKLSTNIEHAL